MEALCGVTASDASTAEVTVTIVEPDTEPDAAEIVVWPRPAAVARPAVIVATLADEELQVTVEVRFCVLPSVYVPVAVNCCLVPSGMDGFAGVTPIETSAGGVTVTVAPALVTPP